MRTAAVRDATAAMASRVALMRCLLEAFATPIDITPELEKRDDAEAEAAARDAEQRGHTTVSPPSFSEATSEPNAFQKLGIIGYCTPGPQVTALFRQHWYDFHVTELPDREDAPLSRVPDFRLPTELPAALRETQALMTGADPSDVSAGVGSAAPNEGDGHGTTPPKAPVDRDESDAILPGHDHDAADRNTWYSECVLHKQHVAHPVSVQVLSKALKIHPARISVSGIKDFQGDTLQRVRFEQVAPAALRDANRRLSRYLPHAREDDHGVPTAQDAEVQTSTTEADGSARPMIAVARPDEDSLLNAGRAPEGSFMRMSHFAYKDAKLHAGELWGNHFKILLRDVSDTDGLVNNIRGLQERGFPNFYGCQRFSWFGGPEDASVALLQNDILLFTHRFLDYTSERHSLRELLQRDRKYPLPFQDALRREIIRLFKRNEIEPIDLDQSQILSFRLSVGDILEYAELSPKEEMAIRCLREAYKALPGMPRRFTAAAFCYYLWNIALAVRIERYGQRVLVGDFAIRHDIRNSLRAIHPDDRIEVVTAENLHTFTFKDIVHPPFALNGRPLPDNAVQGIYIDLCERYGINWRHNHRRRGFVDFADSCRPIFCVPSSVSVRTPDLSALAPDAAAFGDTADARSSDPAKTVEVQFALPRGSYANVAVREMLKADVCPGQEAMLFRPLHPSMWDTGEADPQHVPTFQDTYKGFIDGVGFVGEDDGVSGEVDVFNFEGDMFKKTDPFEDIAAWSRKHLVRTLVKRGNDTEAMHQKLFEPAIARRLGDGEASRYIGHTVPLPPNARAKKLFHRVKRRSHTLERQQSAPTMRRGAQKKGPKSTTFQQLSKDSWNR